MFENHTLNRLIAWKCMFTDQDIFSEMANTVVYDGLPVILGEEVEEISSFQMASLLDEVIEEVSSVDEPVYQEEKRLLEFYQELLKVAVIMKHHDEIFIMHLLDWSLFCTYEHSFVRRALDRGAGNLLSLIEGARDHLKLIIFDFQKMGISGSHETLIDSLVEYFEKEVE